MNTRQERKPAWWVIKYAVAAVIIYLVLYIPSVNTTVKPWGWENWQGILILVASIIFGLLLRYVPPKGP